MTKTTATPACAGRFPAGRCWQYFQQAYSVGHYILAQSTVWTVSLSQGSQQITMGTAGKVLGRSRQVSCDLFIGAEH